MGGYQNIAYDEVVTSTYLNDKLMAQTISRFADAGSRDAAITAPQTNQYAYVAGVGLTRYNGTAWQVEIAATTPSPVATRVNFTSFFSTWTNYGGVYQAPSYYKSQSGIVGCEGMLKAGASSDTAEYVAVLPAGYRPANTLIFPVMCRFQNVEGIARMQVGNNGQLLIVTARGTTGAFTATTDWVSLAGISFLQGA